MAPPKCTKEMRMTGFASLIAQRFVEAVESSSVLLEPFPHLVVDSVLPTDVYRRVSDELPSFSDLASVPETGAANVAAYDRRITLAIEELSSPGGQSVWDDVDGGLKSNEVERVLVQSFSPWIDGNIGQALGGPFRRQIRIHRDHAGFNLNPHTDAPAIFITSFIYVSSGDPDHSLDTVLYKPVDPEARLRSLEGKEYAHEDPGDHQTAGRVVFRPNRMFSFLRTVSSLHGVGPASVQAAPRHLISLRLKHLAQSA
jgi:hypothetical protein